MGPRPGMIACFGQAVRPSVFCVQIAASHPHRRLGAPLLYGKERAERAEISLVFVSSPLHLYFILPEK